MRWAWAAWGTNFPPCCLVDNASARLLARTLITQPRLLLLDEPFAALDLALREQLRQELDRLLRQLGVPLILITHDPDDIAPLGMRCST